MSYRKREGKKEAADGGRGKGGTDSRGSDGPQGGTESPRRARTLVAGFMPSLKRHPAVDHTILDSMLQIRLAVSV
jgi:hypothetical protein